MEGMLAQSTTRRHAIAAACVAACIVLALVATLPAAGRALPPVPAFLPLFAMAVFLTEGLTAFMLGAQFLVTGYAFLACLASAYVFTTLAVVLQMLVFPGVFAPAGMFGAGAQSAIWIWVFWHGGFPALVLGAMLVRAAGAVRITPRRHARFALLCLALPLAASASLCWLAIRHGDALPALIRASSYLSLSHNVAGLAVCGLSVMSLLAVLLISRLRTVLELWLGVAMLANVADVVLTLRGSARFTQGWYVARMLAIIASTALLAVLIWEVNRLYRELQRAHRRLREFSIRDGLTGVFNRRHFDERLARELGAAARSGAPLSLLIADVDHFKRYNDTMGHQRGDDCLIAIAAALARHVEHRHDMVARYGGEEFAVILPGTDAATARETAERLRAAILALDIHAPYSTTGCVTLSVGATTFTGGNVTVRSMVVAADTALYMAKHAGRNRAMSTEIAMPL
jgi:diguanylate cyclase (GGDEF)-like protein